MDLAKRMGESDDALYDFVKRFLEFSYGPKSDLKVIDSIEEKYRNITYSELVAILKKFDEDDGWKILGPQSAELVEKIEKKSGIKLPSSLKKYLTEIGGMQLGDYCLPSIEKGYRGSENTLFSHANHLKKYHSLPNGYFCLDFDHERSYSACLDLRLMEGEECPVVLYDKNEQKFEGCIAFNFDLWFRNEMASYIKLTE